MTTTRVRRVLAVLRDGPGAQVPGDGERGSAVVEFLGGAVVLVVPLVYLVLTLAQLQAAAFAAEGAARDTGRIVATADDPERAGELAAIGVELAFADQGIEVDGADALAVRCAPSCSAPGAVATVRIAADVPLPWWPGGALTVPVTAEAVTVIDSYRVRS
ncbi:pilus assembly protein [Litorihabitans aurantiacus]|uniref:pilus assembly protein n=1 Tax=Litorihabitans aurantiacus TaxID=1930061 RepID=UPI0024E1627F|nr:pilus assembly protein [Litorihabitans aurantiacus]